MAIPIETAKERQQAAEFWGELIACGDSVPGWMYDESGLQEVLDRLDEAIQAYDAETEND